MRVKVTTVDLRGVCAASNTLSSVTLYISQKLTGKFVRQQRRATLKGNLERQH